MAINKNGQIIFVWIMMAIVCLIAGIAFIEPLKMTIDNNTNVSGFNCSDTSNSYSIKATCTIVDMSLFYFVCVVISVGLALVTGSRTIFGVISSIVVFIVTITLINPLKDFLLIARDASHLNCAATSISIATRMTCIFVDLWLFMFVIICIAAGITYIWAKKVAPALQGETQ